jgi:hypothetical protein
MLEDISVLLVISLVSTEAFHTWFRASLAGNVANKTPVDQAISTPQVKEVSIHCGLPEFDPKIYRNLGCIGS